MEFDLLKALLGSAPAPAPAPTPEPPQFDSDEIFAEAQPMAADLQADARETRSQDGTDIDVAALRRELAASRTATPEGAQARRIIDEWRKSRRSR